MIAAYHAPRANTAVIPAVFRRIDGPMTTRYPIPVKDVVRNIRTNIARDLPKIHQRADWGKWKGEPIAIVGGGTSLRKTLTELRAFKTIMACGSVHDFLVENGIVPQVAVACSTSGIPGESVCDFMRRDAPGCEYLLATSVDPLNFEALAGRNICMWNSNGGLPDDVFNGEPAVNGGSTVTLRAINLAILLGYHEVHLFGLDSCFDSQDDNHAYDAGPRSKQGEIRVRVGDQGPEFLTNIGWLAQAREFQEMLDAAGHLFHPIIHGDGLIAEIMKQRGH